jgi:phage-related protein (TIGR01555 family)
MQKYSDPADKRFGQVQTWMVSPANGMPYQVHESRCIVVDGAPVPSRVREVNDGWGASKLQHAYEQLTRLNMSHHWANSLLERSQQAVHGIPDLTNILRAPGGESMVRQRIDLVDMARGVNNTVVIDAQESYDLKSTPLSGVDALVDRLGIALSAVTGMPETLLFGRAPGGLSNSAKNDLENWYAKIEQQQKTIMKPAIDKIVGVLLHALGQYVEDYKIEFKPLWMPSKKERIETEHIQAKTDEIYVNMGALDGSEMRKIMADRGYEIEEIVLMPEIDLPESAIEAAQMQEPVIPEVPDGDQVKAEAEAELIKAKADALQAETKRQDELHRAHMAVIDEALGGE